MSIIKRESGISYLSLLLSALQCMPMSSLAATTRIASFLLTSGGPVTSFLSGLKATINPAMRPIVAKAIKSANKVFFLCGAKPKGGEGQGEIWS